MDIVVGVSGGIAAYKSVQLVRLLVKAGHDVTVVPTEDALRFVGAPTWEAISRNPVTTSVHDDVARVRHVALGQAADLVVVAPATANTLARMAAGIADNLLGTTLLATTAPVLVAPAMHAEMWAHPATRANMRTLVGRGVHVIGPDDGELAGGDSGPGRMSEPEAIAEAALRLLAPQDLAGLRVAVSAGGTREPIDPVRYLGNRSSGRQGAALAVEAAERGADVDLVAANLAGDVLAAAAHPRIRIHRVGTAAELATAMKDAAAAADVVVMAAAVADYRPAQAAAHKLTKEDGILERIELVENEDVLAALGASRRDGAAPEGQILVGFAAETSTDADSRRERARRKRARKGTDLLAVNLADADHGFEKPDNAVEIIGPDGEVVAAVSGSKRRIATALWDAVVALRP
ncbi:phosphopantothenoylcysteine decarboxylase / phosphopantothenate--cysteine ligase [Microbacterium azadirachtae]|uniref:Coenzyme A biosynthesis bifunctional protein CoaBC n=1 Tax=Microbacterium azadirachtae TaxID=582680 RepID=A0A1I6HYQ6_9MICO|nr:bifunctional phosphopantothenoylcysteine decarboxylase/phosphopantothenate--cysteine ligase CoaBC [Microbacterium azadirachtae]SFR59581.1 phosphopantothenoylcysteine decarboxylase / phosphopantothenate--cysteine ligase [Microbacterium azadirachtae]